MAIAPDGRVYVADQTNHRMQVLDPNGRFLATWGKYGTKPGEFGGNYNVKSHEQEDPDFNALDTQGNVDADKSGHQTAACAEKFTAEGAVSSWPLAIWKKLARQFRPRV